MIRTLIIDDENKSRQVLKKLLAEYQADISVIGEAASVQQAYEEIIAEKPELVFLDIQMPSGSGFELLEKFSPLPFDVIFVTSYDEYAISAIRFSALDYLLKPIDTSELGQAIEKAKAYNLSRQNRQVQIINLLNSLDAGSDDKRVGLHVGSSVRFLSAGEITCIEGQGPYSTVYTAEGEKITTAKTLKEFEDFFAGQNCFIRINKSFLVNIHSIKSYSKGPECTINLKNGLELEVSRRKKTEVLEKLNNK